MNRTWAWLFTMMLSQGLAADTTKKPKILADEYKDIIQVNKYSPALREFVAKILKAIAVFDCFDLKVKEMRPFFNEGSELSAAAFDALRGLKKTQTEYTTTVSQSLIQLRDMDKGFLNSPDVVTGLDDTEKPCFSGGVMFEKEDCQSCKHSTPSFKTKHLAKLEMRIVIMQMQENIPKQFLYYASDIFIVTAEAIRIIDKILTCHEQNQTNCDSRDKTIAKFTLKMNGVVQKEKDHVKMISQEKVKMQSLVQQLVQQVQATSQILSKCLDIKRSSKKLRQRRANRNKKIDPKIEEPYDKLKSELEAIAKKYGLVFEKINPNSTHINISFEKPKKTSIGSKLAKILARRRFWK